MNETIEDYLAFLWTQLQYDWSVFTNPWVLYTVIPALFYVVFFWIKWLVLLAPITVPLSLLRSTSSTSNGDYEERIDELVKKIK